MPSKSGFEALKIGLDEHPIVKSLLPPSWQFRKMVFIQCTAVDKFGALVCSECWCQPAIQQIGRTVLGNSRTRSQTEIYFSVVLESGNA